MTDRAHDLVVRVLKDVEDKRSDKLIRKDLETNLSGFPYTKGESEDVLLVHKVCMII